MYECVASHQEQTLQPETPILPKDEGVEYVALPRQRYDYLRLKLDDYGLTHLLHQDIPPTELTRMLTQERGTKKGRDWR